MPAENANDKQLTSLWVAINMAIGGVLFVLGVIAFVGGNSLWIGVACVALALTAFGYTIVRALAAAVHNGRGVSTAIAQFSALRTSW